MELSEITAEVVRLGDAIRAYWDRELPKHFPNYPEADPLDPGPPPPAEEAVLRQFLFALPADQLSAVLAVMYLGRGDDRPERFEHLLSLVRRTFPEPGEAVAQLLGKAALSEYVSDGLEALRRAGIELDRAAARYAPAA